MSDEVPDGMSIHCFAVAASADRLWLLREMRKQKEDSRCRKVVKAHLKLYFALKWNLATPVPLINCV